MSEWKRPEEIGSILRPFAIPTNQLLTNIQSLLYVLAANKDLQRHIDDLYPSQLMAAILIYALDGRFAKYLKTGNNEFDPLLAVAFLSSPEIARAIC
jgi:hypothetical protein